MDNKYIKIIKGTPLFQGMSDEEIAQFLRPDGSGIKSFRKESYIFHAGDKTAYFGILLEGKALIERDELWGCLKVAITSVFTIMISIGRPEFPI